MLDNQQVDKEKILVELSVIPLGVNGKAGDHISEVQNIIEKTGVPNERTSSGTYFEGDWSDICTLLYACYENLHKQSPHSYPKVAIR